MSGDSFLIHVCIAAVCAQRVLTFVCNNLGGLKEKTTMLQVHHLPLETILHHIYKSKLITQVLSREEGRE